MGFEVLEGFTELQEGGPHAGPAAGSSSWPLRGKAGSHWGSSSCSPSPPERQCLSGILLDMALTERSRFSRDGFWNYTSNLVKNSSSLRASWAIHLLHSSPLSRCCWTPWWGLSRCPWACCPWTAAHCRQPGLDMWSCCPPGIPWPCRHLVRTWGDSLHVAPTDPHCRKPTRFPLVTFSSTVTP